MTKPKAKNKPDKNVKISKKAKDLYANVKESFKKSKGGRPSSYDEEFHCSLVIDIFSKGGTLAEFCVKTAISDNTFYNWTNKHRLFFECWRIGFMMGEEAWEKTGKDNNHDPEWNMEYWKTIGSRYYNLGKSNKIRLNVEENANPYKQYQQLLKQARIGEFTASEIKQLSETVNIGVRSYETFNLEEEVKEMKKLVELMKKNNVTSIRPVESIKKAN